MFCNGFTEENRDRPQHINTMLTWTEALRGTTKRG